MKALILLSLLVCTVKSFACRDGWESTLDDFDKATNIYLGTVSGIRLASFEAANADAKIPANEEIDLRFTVPETIAYRVLARRNIVGAEPPIEFLNGPCVRGSIDVQLNDEILVILWKHGDHYSSVVLEPDHPSHTQTLDYVVTIAEEKSKQSKN